MKSRRKFTAVFKAKVALEAIRERDSLRSDDVTVNINYDKIKEDERWDGLKGRIQGVQGT